VSQPRDKAAVARSEADRELICRIWRALWLKYSSSWPPGKVPTGKAIETHLLPHRKIPLSTIYWHMKEIKRLELKAQRDSRIRISLIHKP
jgi:hypothetical protein